MTAPAKLTVYMRSYCHLCEDMLRQLQPHQQLLGFELDIVDIDGEPGLEQAYGRRVPVLTAPEREICHYSLDVRALEQYFGQT